MQSIVFFFPLFKSSLPKVYFQYHLEVLVLTDFLITTSLSPICLVIMFYSDRGRCSVETKRSGQEMACYLAIFNRKVVLTRFYKAKKVRLQFVGSL